VLAWAKENGISGSPAEVCKHPKVYELIQKDIKAINEKLPSYETVKKFAVVFPDFSIESGELTPTLKVKRKVVTERYKDVLDGFYQSGGGGD
jgi:long-chain acyl-CoA synthetase